MLNKSKHQLIMGRVLRHIYSDTTIASILGFKGGTCAYFFYGLNRFSVDLDFDLLQPQDKLLQQLIFERLHIILEQYGEIKDDWIKRYTIFFLLSYGDADHNIKLEVNIRLGVPTIKTHYELREYLGISMLVAKKDYLFASKLAALTQRSQTAMRDIYDVWYFAHDNWDINTAALKAMTSQPISDYLSTCIKTIEAVQNNEILQGLGELISEQDKIWVKKSLRQETIFLLKNYQSVLK